jgi:hypothetical protein
MMHTHFNNLKFWLKSVNKLDTYKVARNTKQVLRITVELFLSYVV